MIDCKPTQAFCAIQGDDELYELNFSTGDGVPFDITNYEVTFSMVKNQGDDEASAIIPLKNAVISDGVNGKATLELTHTETRQPLASYFYKIKMISPQGKIKTILKGTFSIVWSK